jgi:hypothetical protein
VICWRITCRIMERHSAVPLICSQRNRVRKAFSLGRDRLGTIPNQSTGRRQPVNSNAGSQPMNP